MKDNSYDLRNIFINIEIDPTYDIGSFKDHLYDCQKIVTYKWLVFIIVYNISFKNITKLSVGC